ncbi:hypothetical protein GCM10029992_27010 [Glycomyces albus]
MDDADPAVSGGLQRLAGAPDRVGVEVDGGDRPVLADQFGQERRVVAGAGADLEHPLAGADVELLEHLGDDRRLGGRTDRIALAVALGDDHFVLVGGLDRDLGHEPVSGHGEHRPLDLSRLQGAALAQLGDEGRATPPRLSAFRGSAGGVTAGARVLTHMDKPTSG